MSKKNWQPTEIDIATDVRLRNWGDWVRRNHRTKPATCASIEGAYRAPRDQTQDEFHAMRNPWSDSKPDEIDASLLDRVIKAQWFPVKERGLLVAHYVMRLPKRTVAELLHIGRKHHEYDTFHARSVIILRNRLDIVEKRVHSSSHNSGAAHLRAVRDQREVAGPGASKEREAPQALAA